MKPINDKTMIELLLSRLSNSKMIDEIVVATTNQENDLALAELVDDLGYRVFRGSQLDVLDRYLGAAEMAGAEVVVRITGDCPLIDPDVVDECVRKFFSAKVDYLSNTQPPSFPDGLDT
ncbi:MAG: cytidylyltransferase domain-containing protein, partial [Actinomycetota bacterium]